jgi:hypothetical protein
MITSIFSLHGNLNLSCFSRPNEDFDKLVKKVMDNDLILRAYVGEAEMLIFPSILLPERHQSRFIKKNT